MALAAARLRRRTGRSKRSAGPRPCSPGRRSRPSRGTGRPRPTRRQLALAAQQLDELAQAHSAASVSSGAPSPAAASGRASPAASRRAARSGAASRSQSVAAPRRTTRAAARRGRARTGGSTASKARSAASGVAARRSRGEAGHDERPEVVVVGETAALGAQVRAAGHEPREQLDGVESPAAATRRRPLSVEVVAGEQPRRQRGCGPEQAARAVVRAGSPRRRARWPAGSRPAPGRPAASAANSGE